MQLVDWLDDLCVRFIINLPQEELESVERICFQVEEAQWFYEDFIRPLDPTLPSMNLKKFCLLIFQHCPLLSEFSSYHHTQAYSEFLAYKTRVPVRGAIMLNDTMDHAVLVKGWKKGAKWSFPRGKINKDEKDLDCAIREVYEETGFDIKEAGLVRDESDMKYIEVSMREQHMRLYVFRGVPMDTYFEPRTRKEISKISWYKLSNLPTLKRNRQQQHQQQGNGEDLLKDNMFYMVAPFLGPLRHWIKQQRKLDGMQAERGIHLALPPVSAETDLEETEADDDAVRIGNLTADEGPPLPRQPPEEEDSTQLLANLSRSHRASDNLPEVSIYAEATPDPAAELKRLLSVGRPMPSEQPVPVAQQKEQNPLLAMLQGSSGPSHAQPANPPVRSFEQINTQPAQPRSPHHHHPQPPPFSSMASPPALAFSPGRSSQPIPPNSHHPQPSEYLPARHQNGFHTQYQAYRPPQPANFQHPVFSSSHGPNIPSSFGQETPRPYQRTGDPQFAQAPQFPGLHGPAIPPASKLPPPKLTAHTLTLLNAFKSSDKSTFTTPKNPKIEQFADRFSNANVPQASRTSHIPEAVSPSSGQSPFEISSVQSPRAVFSGQSPVTQPAAPKPRNAHQDALLNLFRSPSASISTPPSIAVRPDALEPEPIELAAHPSPGLPRQPSPVKGIVPRVGHKTATLTAKLPRLGIMDYQQPRKPSLTSATVSGPLNAPDFETVRRQTRQAETNGHTHEGISPSMQLENKPLPPISILSRPLTASQDIHSPSRTPPIQAPRLTPSPKPSPFHPQILRHPPQGPQGLQAAHAPLPSSPLIRHAATVPTPVQHTAAPVFDRRGSLPSDQKSALLSLFSKPATNTTTTAATTAAAAVGIAGIAGIAGMAPGTPRVATSGIRSPVSPLPDKSSVQDSPAALASRSRISSIGDGAPVGAGATVGGLGEGVGKAAGVLGEGKGVGMSSVNKSFLLGFLEDVARGKR